jgi:hypothetical protein
MPDTPPRSYPNLRPRSILLAAAILELLDSARRREPALDHEDILEALELTRDEVVSLMEEQDWN